MVKYRGYKTAQQSLRAMIFGDVASIEKEEQQSTECIPHCINIGGTCTNCGKSFYVPSIDDIRKELA